MEDTILINKILKLYELKFVKDANFKTLINKLLDLNLKRSKCLFIINIVKNNKNNYSYYKKILTDETFNELDEYRLIRSKYELLKDEITNELKSKNINQRRIRHYLNDYNNSPDKLIITLNNKLHKINQLINIE